MYSNPKINQDHNRYIRQKEVLELIPFSKSTLWRKVSDGSFPAPIKLSPGVTAWRMTSVQAWIASKEGTK